MRLYSVAVASLAIDAPTKWLDNLLSHHQIPGVIAERRGVARRIPHGALMHLALVRELHVALHLGVRDAINVADALQSGGDAAVHASGHLRVTFDRAALEHDVTLRLRAALESAPAPRRGPTPRRGVALITE